MIGGAEHPLRVVVTGSSIALYTRPYRRGPEEGTYGQELERQLLQHGIPAQMTNQAGWLLTVNEIYREVAQRVISHNPDVVVLNVGWVECQPRLTPLGVLRWQESWHPSLHPVAKAARSKVEPALRAFHRRVEPRLLERLPWSMHRMGPERFEVELRRLVTLIRREQQCLVLVLNINPTNARVAAALPGIHDHAARFSAIVDRVASGDDPGVRLVDSRSFVTRYGADAVLPDGIHFNAEGHRLLGGILFDEVQAWRCEMTRADRRSAVRGRS
jgi:lysophospholipase L1-like esterase